MEKQTAVEWLIDQVEDFIGLIPKDIIEQAKEMDKEQKKSVIQEPEQDFETVAENKDEIGHIGHRMHQKLNEEMEEWMRADDNNKDFTLHEQALELRELGFDEPCFGSYIDGKLTTLLDSVLWGDVKGDVPAPTYSQAFRWFDENTSFQGFVIASLKEGHFDWEILNLDTEEKIQCKEYYHTRLEAELECLKELINLVKNK